MPRKKVEPWYAEKGGFFGPSYLEEYSAVMPEERTLREVNFLIENLPLQQGMSILDMPCGHGRHVIELAKRGYKVTGQDVNSFFLHEARKAAKAANVSLRLIKGDMRAIHFESEFDVAINIFTSFGYLESGEEDQKALHQIAKSLKLNGLFVLDFINRERLIRNFQYKWWRELPDDDAIVGMHDFNLITGRMHDTRIRIGKKGKKEEVGSTLRLYSAVELISMCKEAGLVLQKAYGDFDASTLTLDSRRVILVTRKQLPS